MESEQGHFSVIAVTYFKKQGYQRTVCVNFTQRSTAYAWCDRLQDDIDQDGHPARAYVIDKDGVPIRAGRTPLYPANHFFAKFEPRRQQPRRAA